MFDQMPRWRLRGGLCRGVDPQIFDGEPGYDETAKAICRRCDVQADCRQYALENNSQVVGVWGGLNEAERRALLRGGGRKTCPGCRGQRHFSDGYDEICLSCGLTWKL